MSSAASSRVFGRCIPLSAARCAQLRSSHAAWSLPGLPRRLIAIPSYTVHRAVATASRAHSTRAADSSIDDSTGHVLDDALDAYEDLLLNATADTTTATVTASTAASEPVDDTSSHVTAAPADVLVASALSLLPPDGSPARLTDLTPFLDVEAISDRFGSVRAFLQSFPRAFTCTSEVVPGPGGKTQTRWLVNRRAALSTSRGHAVAAASSAIATAASSAAREDDADAVARLQRLMAVYLEEELTRLATPAKAHRETPEADKGSNVSAWLSPSSSGENVRTDALSVPPWDESIPFDDDDDTCAAGEDDDHLPTERDADGLSTVAVVYTPAQDTLRAQTTRKSPAKQAKPTKPTQKRTSSKSKAAVQHPGGQNSIATTTTAAAAAAARTPEALQALHTALAERRGWLTPLELLDLLVACVPTFWVPVTAIVATDALAKRLGPRGAMPRVLEVYTYFFEFHTAADTTHSDAPVRYVRLGATVSHAQRGQADAFYRTRCGSHLEAQDDGASPAGPVVSAPQRAPRLQQSTVTAAFAPLHATIPSRPQRPTTTGLKPEQRHGRTSQSTTAAASTLGTIAPLKPGANLFACAERGDETARVLAALCAVVPWTRYVTVAEAAAGIGVAPERVRDTLEQGSYHTHHALFLTRRGDDASSHSGTAPCTVASLRLRPFFLSPSATDDRSSAELPEPVRALLRPMWTSLARFLTKLPDHALATLQADAHAWQTAQGARSGETEATAWRRPAPFTAEAEYLMQYGRLCWVQQRSSASTSPTTSAPVAHGGTGSGGLFSIRAFTGDPALDDLGPHALTMLLHHHAHPTAWQPLSHVLIKAETAVTETTGLAAVHASQPLRQHPLVQMSRDVPGAQLSAFLSKQRLLLEVEARTAAGASPTLETLWLRRRTVLASFNSV